MNLQRLQHILIVVLLSCYQHVCSGWISSAGWRRAPRFPRSSNVNFATDSCLYARDGEAALEVVGASGRMGSQWLRQNGSVAVPRGVSSGCLSSPGVPIFVATPSKYWNNIYQETLTNRRQDLVWVGNGLPLPEFGNCTLVVPHYGILSAGDLPITSPESPPTFVYGKHAERVSSVLEKEGIQTEIVESWNDIQSQAAQKLLWASCMWLLCHSSEPPLTVEAVHDEQPHRLYELIQELLPALEHIIGVPMDLNRTLAYFESYSRSMPGAIPNKKLAMDEVQGRNGVWWQVRSRVPQPLHEKLLLQVGGRKVIERLNQRSVDNTERKRHVVNMTDIDLSVWGTKLESGGSSCRSAIVIGGGIVGSSIALNLARRGVQVTVLDRLSDSDLGETTPASWAWINANQKAPLLYQWLNQLGIRSWQKDGLLAGMPTWNGSLVQCKEPPRLPGGYVVEGPLSAERLHELEPQANFSYRDGPIYFFAEEGCVDPFIAVRTIRTAAKDLGVEFVANQNVTALTRNEQGRVTSVQSNSLDTNESLTTEADVVVVAAGVGSAAPELGGLPLMHNPGQIAFARPKESPPLKRILVDTHRESYVLQRQDGTLVAGGGYLQVGGPASSVNVKQKSSSRSSRLLELASELAPQPLQDAEYSHTTRADRPMPKDGWPAIGYLEDGLFCAVTHSGITLAPIVGPLIAAEIAEAVELDLLEPYRPSRFADS